MVILDTQLKAIGLLQTFADLHPLVVNMKPSSPKAIEAMAFEPITEDDAIQQLEALQQTERQYAHVFTHTLKIDGTFQEALDQLVRLMRAEANASYWASTQQVLPLSPPDAPTIVVAEVAKVVEAATPAAAVEVRIIEPQAVSTTVVIAAPAPINTATIRPRTVVIRRNPQKSFGFSVLSGIEDDRLPSIRLKPDTKVIMFVGQLLSHANLLTPNSAFLESL